CVAVCPTGIDIRNGAQLECIMCGLCIDACDNVMTKVGRPAGLIAYDNDVNIKRRQAGQENIFRLVRPRTAIYAAIIVFVGAIMLYTPATRSFLDINVLHDRNPLAVRLSDGSVRNAYTVRLLNKQTHYRTVALDVDGIAGARVQVVGSDAAIEGRPYIAIGPDQTAELRVRGRAPTSPPLDKSPPLPFRAPAPDPRGGAAAADHFFLP